MRPHAAFTGITPFLMIPLTLLFVSQRSALDAHRNGTYNAAVAEYPTPYFSNILATTANPPWEQEAGFPIKASLK